MVLDRSFAITIRTRIGISDQHKEQFLKWIKGQDYGTVVYEQKGDKTSEHIHAQIWLNAKRTKGNVKKPLRKMIERLYHPEDYHFGKDEHGKDIGALVVKNAWSCEWKTYCEKDEALEYESIPAKPEDFYPSKEEQEQFMKIAEKTKNWNLWDDLKGKWEEYGHKTINEYTVAKFLAESMFVKKNIRVQADPRKAQQMCKALQRFLEEDSVESAKHFLPKDKHQLLTIFLEV